MPGRPPSVAELAAAMRTKLRFASMGLAAGVLVMALGLLIVGGDPNGDEAKVIVLTGLFAVGGVMGALAELRDQARRCEEAERTGGRR